MSYAAPAPAAPDPAPRRPVTVRLATALLTLMASVGLVYAVVTLAVTPGVVDRFRDAASGTDGSDVDAYVTVVWIGAALGAVLAVLLVALVAVLAMALRRGSNGARIGTWVVCALGVLFGCGAVGTVAAQRAGQSSPGTVEFALSEAYPDGWIGVNVGLTVAQMAGYSVVAILLVAGPREFFGRGHVPVAPAAYVALPTYGTPQPSYRQTPGISQPPSAPPAPGPDDDYWARPSS
jgi:hypothetical protein